MKNRKKMWLIISIIIAVGFILTLLGLFTGTKNGIYFDSKGLHVINDTISEDKELNLGEIQNIDINLSHMKIIFEESDTFGIIIRRYDDDNEILWNVNNGTLKVTEKSEIKLRLFSLDLRFLNQETRSYVKIYLPKDTKLNNVSINIKDSNIKLSNLKSDNLNIKNGYGKVELEKIETSSLKVEMNDGSFSSKSLVAEQISLVNSYGRVNFDELTTKILLIELKDGNLELNKAESEETNIKNRYGKINAINFTSENTTIEAKDGSIKIDGDLTGNTQIQSTYGKVELDLKQAKTYYSLDLTTKYGKIRLDDDKLKESQNLTTTQDNGKTLKVNAKDGNININFNK